MYLFVGMRPDVDGRRVEPDEERLAVLALAVEVVEGLGEHLAVEGLHALAGQLSVVLDLLLADAAELRVDRRVVHGRRPGVQHVARPHLRQVGGVLLARVVELLRLLLGVQVVEVAVPLVEAVHRRQELVAVAQVVLAELRGVVSDRLQDFREGRILLLEAEGRARDADGRLAGADRQLARDERRAAGGAARLAVVVGEQHAVAWRGCRCSASGPSCRACRRRRSTSRCRHRR